MSVCRLLLCISSFRFSWLRPAGIAFFFFSLSVQAAHYHDDVEAYSPWKDGRGLGELSIQVTTENEKARKHFLTGIKLVHTYEFPEAMWSFREAQKLDAGFAMAYWGEMLASQMLVWNSRVVPQAKDAQRRMQENVDFSLLSPLEIKLIEATGLLFEDRGKPVPAYDNESAVWRFRNAMATLHKEFPHELEVQVLYAYSIIGTRRGVRDFKNNLKAALLLQEVLKDNPKHPGALHYLLHASENPQQAFMAEQAAKTFADIASASIHALHMPSHYYYVLGDWDKVIEINQRAWEASLVRDDARNLGEDSLEYHGFGWIIYALLQKGRHSEAFSRLRTLYELYNKSPTSTKLKYLLFARAGFLVDSPKGSSERARILADSITYEGPVTAAMAADTFASGYAAMQAEQLKQVKAALTEYESYLDKGIEDLAPPDKNAVRIMHVLLKGIYAWGQGNLEQAASHFLNGSIMEDNMVHEHGLPLVVKPANELYGEYLASNGDLSEAIQFYQKSLRYQPGRLNGLFPIKTAD